MENDEVKLAAVEAYLDKKRSGAASRGGAAARWPFDRVKRVVAGAWLKGKAAPIHGLARAAGTHFVIVDLPRFGGQFEVDRRSHLFDRLVVDRFERELAQLLYDLLEPDDAVVDVGANIGLFTMLAATRASEGRVLAVEASPRAARILERNVARNGLENVTIYAGAVSNHANGVTLVVAEGNEEYASIGGIVHPNAPVERGMQAEVDSVTLDSLLEAHRLVPSVVKMDIEGAEGLALEGASTMLSRHRPLLITELDDRLLGSLGHRVETVLARLRDHDYTVYCAHSGRPLSGSEDRDYVGEVIALPS